jgi:hypothetical protein
MRNVKYLVKLFVPIRLVEGLNTASTDGVNVDVILLGTVRFDMLGLPGVALFELNILVIELTNTFVVGP